MKKILSLILLFLSLRTFSQDYSSRPSFVPFPLNLSYKTLTHSLCRKVTTDEEKAWVIYSWIARHVRYDVRALTKMRHSSTKPGIITLRHKAVCEGYCNLFVAMCHEAGIAAYKVEGYSKSIYFDPGDRFYKDDHSWNAVRLSGKWYLLDVCFGSGGVVRRKMPVRRFVRKLVHLPTVRHKLKFKRHFNPDYFCMDPAHFFLDHAPTDPHWQLLREEEILHTFEGWGAPTDSAEALNWKPTKSTGTESPDLDTYILSDPINRLVTKSDRGYEYDIRNNRVKAYTEIALADTFFNQGGRRHASTEERIEGMRRSGEHCKEALSYLICQHYDILEEYKLLGEKNKNKNTLAAKQFQVVLDSNNRKIKALRKVMSSAYSRRHRIRAYVKAEHRKGRVFEKLSVEKVSPAKHNKPFNDSLVKLNSDTIRLNHLYIDSIQTEIKKLKEKIKKCDAGFLKLEDTLREDLFPEKMLVKDAIKLRVKMEDNYKLPIKENKQQFFQAKIKENRDFRKAVLEGTAEARETTEQVMQDLIKIRIRYKSNEKLIKANKHLSVENPKFDEEFDQENSLLIGTVDQMEDLLSEERSTLRYESRLLNKDIRHYSKQNSLLNKEWRTENERMRQEQKRLNKCKKRELNKNAAIQKAIKKLGKHCKQIITTTQKQLAKKSAAGQ